MTGDDPAVPAAKCQKYVAFGLSEKIWLLDYGKKHPKVNSDDCGKALAAEVNANVPEHEKHKDPGKNTVNGWENVETQLKVQYEKESAQGTTGKVRSMEAKHAQMEEALYVWLRQMQGRDMPLTEEIIRETAKQLGLQLKVPDNFGYSGGWLHNLMRYGIKSYVLHGEAGSANQEGVELAQQCWLNTALKDCVSPLTIRNCWHKAGILPEGWIAAPTGTHAQAARRTLSGEEAAQPAAPPAAQPATDSAAESADEVEISRNVDLCAHVAATENADEAFQLLDTALQDLQVCVQNHGTLLPHNDVIMSANEFHELDREHEVCEELYDVAIVQMIQSDNAADAVDSDEDEADDFVGVTTTKAQALQLASDLHEFALAQPQLFHASDVAALQNMRTALDKRKMRSRKQLTLTDLFAVRRGP
jgi:hypothetical protein